MFLVWRTGQSQDFSLKLFDEWAPSRKTEPKRHIGSVYIQFYIPVTDIVKSLI